MLEFFGRWFQTLILVMILAALVEMLLPSRSMERYVRLVLSLTVLMAVLTPVFQLLNSQWPDEERFRMWYEGGGGDGAGTTNLLPEAEPLLELQQQQAVELLEREMEKSIAADVATRFPLEVERVDVTVEPSVPEGGIRVQAVELVVRPPSDDGATPSAAAGASPGSGLHVGVQPVEVRPVDIQIPFSDAQTSNALSTGAAAGRHFLPNAAEGALFDRLRNWLAARYELDEGRVSVSLADGR